MTSSVRVRFAPSPTGMPHVGNMHTAMIDWIVARHFGGSFVLRIEDTDVARTVEGALEYIMEGLRWLGLDWDEGPDKGGLYGPYMQSHRLPLYKEAAEQLVKQGVAYYCYCSPQRLELMRAEQVKSKLPPGYDRHCRALTAEQCREQEAAGVKPVVRFKIPLDGQIVHNDIVYGKVTFDLGRLDDFVILKSDGYPTYHLANVVDDHTMKISHVIRGEEWISSVPRHLLLYKALGYEPPQYVHMPLFLGPDRVKLSKRHGDVSILEFRGQGYLPEALFNFMAIIGWSLDDKTEIMNRQQIVENFSLERIGKTGAIFDRKKLEWMNGVYIRALSPEDFLQRSLPFLEPFDKGLPSAVERPLKLDYLRRVLPLVQERAKTLAEVPELVSFFFVDETAYHIEDLIGKGMTRESTIKALEVSRERLLKLEKFDIETLETVLRPLAEELGLKAGQLFGALRTAATGRIATPPLFETMSVLGKERCLRRFDIALAKLKAQSA